MAQTFYSFGADADAYMISQKNGTEKIFSACYKYSAPIPLSGHPASLQMQQKLWVLSTIKFYINHR
jgi:hypothetical protein